MVTSVGVLICKTRDAEVVEYALSCTMAPASHGRPVSNAVTGEKVVEGETVGILPGSVRWKLFVTPPYFTAIAFTCVAFLLGALISLGWAASRPVSTLSAVLAWERAQQARCPGQGWTLAVADRIEQAMVTPNRSGTALVAPSRLATMSTLITLRGCLISGIVLAVLPLFLLAWQLGNVRANDCRRQGLPPRSEQVNLGQATGMICLAILAALPALPVGMPTPALTIILCALGVISVFHRRAHAPV